MVCHTSSTLASLPHATIHDAKKWHTQLCRLGEPKQPNHTPVLDFSVVRTHIFRLVRDGADHHSCTMHTTFLRLNAN